MSANVRKRNLQASGEKLPILTSRLRAMCYADVIAFPTASLPPGENVRKCPQVEGRSERRVELSDGGLAVTDAPGMHESRWASGKD